MNPWFTIARDAVRLTLDAQSVVALRLAHFARSTEFDWIEAQRMVSEKAQALAQQCFDAVGSKQKTFKVFDREEGGFHHCQVDNVTIGVHYMWDWLEDVLKPGR